ncbi:YcbK family protein [Ensifer aridi]|uniref:YcbK family protein n=1 Tax=Ensifer aridi TaxID=1708715 RepID=UPI000A10E1B4|nr:YcbK family protein [Ensifer aridi]
MQLLESGYGFLSVGRAAALSVALFALAGCVSAVADGEALNSSQSQQITAEAQTAASETEGEAPGEQVAATDSASEQTAGPTAGSGQDAAALQQGLTMQSTALNATSSSIYGQSPPARAAANAADPSQTSGATPGGNARPTVNATSNSLFNGGQAADEQPVLQPQQGAANEAPAAVQTAAPTSTVPETMAYNEVPSAVPLPLSAQAALSGAASSPVQTVEVASVAQVAPPSAGTAQAVESGEPEKKAPETKKGWTLASLFAAKRKEKPRGGTEREVQVADKKTITISNAREPQVASLAYTSLPGVKMNPLFNMEHEDHAADEDDAPVEVANLSGLARLAPNGLILQTEKVETGCFKPALLDMLKTVESHYGRKVMVTSGLRAIKVSRKRQSLHTRCEAADIQVQGVSKWELADFLRSIPGRGGVGTYCHTASVHIDIGPQRDWNWRCRRRKG